MEHSDEYQSAKNRVEAKMSFYTHYSVYAAVILLLAIINFMTSSGAIWFHWPMLGWGIAVALHAAFVFVFPRRFAVTEQMIQKEIGKARERS
ncbi:2TM domain-containing protein [Litoreibacter ponti]|uniref:2TM domain-containing protein n=1 Tax=Litoreibacter ponti TaxID=1510457 RepID=A0A2T6BCP0_9RHOB|nr:2TM domain-containing protein [Litoreibacter ponti]PTX53796.1 2TM domain-containing protein [Litoreibacter ponti]